MISNLFKTGVLSVLVICFTGCATIVESTKQEIVISTEPSGAEVLRSGVAVGTTPITLTVKRKEAGESILVRKEGYEDGYIQTKSKMNGWFWGNVLTGGLYGSTTDIVSGAAYKYDQDKYFLPLRKSGNAMIPLESEIKTYAVVKQVDLRIDLQNGNGDTLQTLLNLANVTDSRQEKIESLRTAATLNSDTIAFADRVREILLDTTNG